MRKLVSYDDLAHREKVTPLPVDSKVLQEFVEFMDDAYRQALLQNEEAVKKASKVILDSRYTEYHKRETAKKLASIAYWTQHPMKPEEYLEQFRRLREQREARLIGNT